MKSVMLETGQRIIKQILDWFQTAKEENISEWRQDLTEAGILKDTLNEFDIIVGTNNAPLTPSIIVKTGVAYDLNGERILIDDDTISYDPTNPADTTDNGKGTPVATPHSTGSKNIPLSTNQNNYIWIDYLQTTDELEFTLQKITNVKQFYKKTDGYEIEVNQTGTNPDSSKFILLGTVDLTGGNLAITANIDISNRLIFRTKRGRVGIETNNVGLTDRPAFYGVGNEVHSLDDHIKSVGNGTISPINPHGISASDLGLEESALVESHRKNEHVNGLISGTPGNPLPLVSGMYVERIIVGLGDDFVRVKPLISGEFALVNGLAFDSTDFPSEVIINFLTGTDAAGSYDIFFDSTTGLVDKVLGSVASDNTKLQLASVIWDNAENLGAPTERRRFGVTNRLQRWVTSSRPPTPIAGNFGFNLDLNKPEYYDGTSWTALP